MAGNVEDINALLGANNQQYKNTEGTPFANTQSEWAKPIYLDDDADFIPKITLQQSSRTDILSTFARQLSDEVQFPPNTAFFHVMSCIASAMNKSFYYSYFGSEAPVNIYSVSSQPPSTGKSGINGKCVDPIRMAYADLNKEQAAARSKIQIKIETLKDQLKSTKDIQEKMDISGDIAAGEEKLAGIPIYNYAVGNATPEALEAVAFDQGGMWNIVSDEAGSVNVVLGNVYGDSSRKSNADLFLQSWDGEWFSSARVTRKKASGYVRGCLCVIAQDETIQTILEEGLRGNGISERVLIMREDNKLGDRDHFKRIPIEPHVKTEYAQLVRDLVFAPKTVLQFSDDAMRFLTSKKQELEPFLADGARYSSNMLRGSMGKMDKQVMKISCVLHAVENMKGGTCNLTISESTVQWAYYLFCELAKMYESAAESKGFAGDKAEIIACLRSLQNKKDKGVYKISLRQIRDNIKNIKVFAGRKNLTNILREQIIPKMQKLNYCVYRDDEHILINPMV